MLWTHRRLWASGLAAGLLLIAGAVASPRASSQGPENDPNPKEQSEFKGDKSQTPQAEVETLRREIEALRVKADALAARLAPQNDPRHIVVSTPLKKDVVVTERYLCKILAQNHIEISPLVSGSLTDVLVKEGQAVKKGEALFQLLPTLYQAKLDIKMAELEMAVIDLGVAENLLKNKVIS